MRKIYIDLDGVMADFDRGLKELCGIEPVDQMASTEADDDRTFTAIRECGHFYRKLEEVPGAKKLFDQLYKKYGDQVEILSGIPNPKRNIQEAEADKLAWVRSHLSDKVKVNLVRRAEKKNFCSGSDCILIDDYEHNIREWKKKGGTGILYRSAEQTLQEVQELFPEEEPEEGIFAMCGDPAPELSIEEARELAENAATEQELADIFAIVSNKAWYIEDDIYDCRKGTAKYERVRRIIDAWFDILHTVQNKIYRILESEGVVIPERGRIEVEIPFMERNGYFNESLWWIPEEEREEIPSSKDLIVYRDGTKEVIRHK